MQIDITSFLILSAIYLLVIFLILLKTRKLMKNRSDQKQEQLFFMLVSPPSLLACFLAWKLGDSSLGTYGFIFFTGFIGVVMGLSVIFPNAIKKDSQ